MSGGAESPKIYKGIKPRLKSLADEANDQIIVPGKMLGIL